MTILEHTQMIHHIALTPNFAQSRVAFAASQEGVLRTGDGGETWQPVGKSVPVTAVLVTDNVVLASAVGEMFTSNDLGETWLSVALPVPTTIVSTLVAHGSIVLAATLDDGVLISNDLGKTWRGWNFGLLDWRVLTLVNARNGTIYADTETGIVLSDNGGRGWKDVFVPENSAIAAIFEADGELFVGTEQGEIFSSNDDGKTWATLKMFEQPINGIAVNSEKSIAVLHGDRLSLHMGEWYHVRLSGVSTMTWGISKSLLIAFHDGHVRHMHVDDLLSKP